MSLLLDLLDDAATTTSVVIDQNDQTLAAGDMWARAQALARSVADVPEPGRPVAMVLDNSHEAIRCLLATWLAGREVISIPPPGRAQPLEDYLAFMATVVELTGPDVLLLPDSYAPLVPHPLVQSYGTFIGSSPSPGGPPLDPHPGAGLVQFSSGSTRRPTGVRLTLDMIGANVLAILDRLDVSSGSGACSWLPLSHDMGLIGMFLAGACAGGPRWADGGAMVLRDPLEFLRDPLSWLRTIEQHRSTITAAPPFALENVARRLELHPEVDLDLSSLQTCITGAERVRLGAVTRFEEQVARRGTTRRIVRPAYGLAEATVAVTLDDGTGDLATADVGGSPIVSSGTPLDGVEVRVAPGGEVQVTGPSVTSSVVGGVLDRTEDGWLRTKDLGLIRDRELFVIGRSDDVILVGGRKVFMDDVDVAAGSVPGVRRGCAIGVPHPDGRAFSIVVEPDGDDRDLVRQVRVAVSRAVNVLPTDVHVTARDTILKTSSGKPRRIATAESLGLTDG